MHTNAHTHARTGCTRLAYLIALWVDRFRSMLRLLLHLPLFLSRALPLPASLALRVWQALSAQFHPRIAFAEARASNKVCEIETDGQREGEREGERDREECTHAWICTHA